MTNHQNEMGRDSGKSATHKATRRNDSDMSTAAQRKRVLEYLVAGPQTTYSLRAKGISHPAQRIVELIREGNIIESSRVTTVDPSGFLHDRVAMYSLVDMPQPNLFAEIAPLNNLAH